MVVDRAVVVHVAGWSPVVVRLAGGSVVVVRVAVCIALCARMLIAYCSMLLCSVLLAQCCLLNVRGQRCAQMLCAQVRRCSITTWFHDHCSIGFCECAFHNAPGHSFGIRECSV